ncbi:MAG: hypothetical protein IKR85_01135 [Clostridia bacterium]|nr:hypothetical protein [Clostridia bacterium]
MTQAELTQPTRQTDLSVIEATQSATEIDLVELLYRLLEKIKYIIAASLLGAVLAFLITNYLIDPEYTATSKLYVLNSGDSVINLSDLQIGNYLANDYTEVFKNYKLHEDVLKDDEIQKLNLTYSPKTLMSMVKISNPSDTRILYINVTSKSASDAMELANAYARVAREFIASVMQTVEPNIFEKARLPENPSSPSKTRNTVIGFVIGLAISCAIIIIKFLADDRIRTTDDLLKYAGLTTLGLVPKKADGPLRAKVSKERDDDDDDAPKSKSRRHSDE